MICAMLDHELHIRLLENNGSGTMCRYLSRNVGCALMLWIVDIGRHNLDLRSWGPWAEIRLIVVSQARLSARQN
jgi:hypothetical protein